MVKDKMEEQLKLQLTRYHTLVLCYSDFFLYRFYLATNKVLQYTD